MQKLLGLTPFRIEKQNQHTRKVEQQQRLEEFEKRQKSSFIQMNNRL